MGKECRHQRKGDCDKCKPNDYGCVPQPVCQNQWAQCPPQNPAIFYQPISSICCDDSEVHCPQPNPRGFSALCDSRSESECPVVEHCKKEKKEKCKKEKKCKESCDDLSWNLCIPRAKCPPKRVERDWSYLCGSDSDSDCPSDSSCSERLPLKVPAVPCNAGTRKEWKDCGYEKKCVKCRQEKCVCKKDRDWRCDSCHRSEKDCGCKKERKCKDCHYPEKHCKCKTEAVCDDADGNAQYVGRAFDVSFVPKAGHPWEHRILGAWGIAVDGKLGKPLHLTRGHYYIFNVVGDGSERFYFTADPMGGKQGDDADSPSYDPVKLEGTPEPIANGKVCLFVSPSIPKMFYYQSRDNRMLGGIVFVHDK